MSYAGYLEFNSILPNKISKSTPATVIMNPIVVLNIENPTEVVKSEPGKEKDTTAPTIEFAESNYQEGSRQIIEKDELASENQELKSQKNGFLGGLFRRKK
jgi:hypothetical protein